MSAALSTSEHLRRPIHGAAGALSLTPADPLAGALSEVDDGLGAVSLTDEKESEIP